MPSLAPDTAAELRKRLDAARQDVIEHIRLRTAGPDEPLAVGASEHLSQPDDMAQATYIGDNEMAQLGREQAQLRDIDSAIARLEEGVANVCAMCGNAIPDERLLAVPTALACVQCQQQLETASGAGHGPTM